MSVQFGKCNFDGKPVDPKELDEVRPVLAPYGPDGEGSICKDNLGILFRAFHTTKESRRERQPYVSQSGFVLTWDGRLDNREELIGRLKGGLSEESTDLEIVATAYDNSDTSAFATLIGDWALSIWDPRDRSIILAKDFVGTRHLYYSLEKDQLSWCTILDPLVLFAGRPWRLEEEYIAGWLAFFPATQLTPYVGIHAVPASCFVRLARGAERITKYWDFDPAKRIHYQTDGDYEEHFRQVFRESVRRRLRSDSPILAELSGGMDSSSIVCMADALEPTERANSRVQTVSYYSSRELNWNEEFYFRKVEEKRGTIGWHIDVGDVRTFEFSNKGAVAFAPSAGRVASESAIQFETRFVSVGYRILLSGIGGDEVAGGVPTPLPELGDLLVQAHLGAFSRQLILWATINRKPVWQLIFDTFQGFVSRNPNRKSGVTWLHASAQQRRNMRRQYSRFTIIGPLPSFQENLLTLKQLRNQLEGEALPLHPLHEKRYPYLDRDLLEFLYATPREQLVRPGQRRSLLRRALRGLTPSEILDRKRKAFVTRTLFDNVSGDELKRLSDNMICSSLGIVNSEAFARTLSEAKAGRAVPLAAVIRTLVIESWLRHLSEHNALPGGESTISNTAWLA